MTDNRTRYRNWLAWIAGLAFLNLVLIILSLAVGAAGIPIKKAVTMLLAGRGTLEYSIIMDVRLPRIVLGLAVGGGLAMAGVLLQAMFRNPLVEPYTLGISGGAAVGVCLNIALKLPGLVGKLSYPLAGFLGAAMVIALVYLLSLRRRILHLEELLLTGVMISFIASAIVMLVLALSRSEDLHGIIYWIMGSLQEPDWTLIYAMIFLSILCLIISLFLSPSINALLLGEEEASHLGVDVEKIKRILFLLASLVTGCAVAVSGIIGFVGLLVPHLLRRLVSSDNRILLPTAFLGGGAFLILSDTISRTLIAPLELPVGVITGIIGGTLFVIALQRKVVR